MYEDISDEELAAIAGISDFSQIPDSELMQIVENDQAQMGERNLSGSLNIFGNDVSVPKGLETAMIGAGKQLTDYGRNIADLYYSATGDDQASQEMRSNQAIEQQYYDNLKAARPGQTMVGEMLPALSTIPLSGGLLTQAGIGSSLGMIDNQNAVEGALSGASWAVGGNMVGRMAPRVFNMISGTASRNRALQKSIQSGQQRLIDRADELGYTLTPGMRTQNKAFKQIEQSARQSPFTSGLTEAGEEMNQKLLNKAALESIGEVGEEIRGDAFARAADRIGKVYDDVAKGVDSVPVDSRTLAETMENMSTEGEMFFRNYFKKYPGLELGKLTGKEFNKISTKLNKDIRGAFANNPNIAEDLIEAQLLLNKSLQKAAPDAADALRVAGTQWKNLKALEKGKAVTNGNVNPQTLGNNLTRIDKGGFFRDRNTSDYYDLVRMAREFGGMPRVVEGSSTGVNQWLPMLATEPSAALSGIALRYPYSKYLQSGGDSRWASLLGAVPMSQPASVVGSRAGVAYSGTE